MVKANELRIGNWVKKDNEYEQVLQLLYNQRGGYSLLEPIPLTPEILEKCGFKRINNELPIYDKGMIRVATDIHCIFLVTFNDTTLLGVTMNSIHQLQNLYFALMGEELKIDL